MKKFTSHKGSWGDSYLIEQPKNKETITCSECIHYCDDGSCSARPIVVSEVGYNFWKYCDEFVLSKDSETDRRYEYIFRTRGRYAIESLNNCNDLRVNSKSRENSTYCITDGVSDKVQLGDTVTIQRLETKQYNKYKVDVSPFTGELPVILESCIGKQRDDTFSIGKIKYMIMHIEKGK